MPNYSLTVNSQFKPFSYQELLHPVMMATQAHQELENQYGELAAKANVWEEMANEQTDPYAYKMYKTYANDLESQAGQLAREGLNAASRRDMLNMRSRYSKEIVPIEQAYTARANEIKEQTAGRAQGMVYEGDAATASLDRYLNNPAIKYRFANSQEGFKRLATAATALSKQLRDYGSGKSLDAYTRTWLQQHGYKSSEIAQAISDIDNALRGDGNVRGNNILQSLLANEMQTAGISDWNTAAKMDYYNRVAPALYQAVGQTQVASYDDYGAKLAAQEAMQKRVARYNKSLEGLQETPQGNLNLRHWEGVLQNGDFDSKTYNNLLSKLTVGGKGLSKNYFGSRFVNPLKIYEEAVKYAKEHPHTKDSKNKGFSFTGAYQGSVGAKGPGAADNSYENAVEVMKKKYGISSVLNPEEYKAMKSLGFNSSSSYTDMYSNRIANAINAKMPLHRASALNSGDYSYASDLIKGSMSRGNDIYDIDNKEKIKYSDLGDKPDITDIAYSMNHKGKILLMMGDKRVAIPATYHSAEAKKILDFYEPMLDRANNNEKAELQDLISMELENLFNSYTKSRTKTSSKR